MLKFMKSGEVRQKKKSCSGNVAKKKSSSENFAVNKTDLGNINTD